EEGPFGGQGIAGRGKTACASQRLSIEIDLGSRTSGLFHSIVSSQTRRATALDTQSEILAGVGLFQFVQKLERAFDLLCLAAKRKRIQHDASSYRDYRRELADDEAVS